MFTVQHPPVNSNRDTFVMLCCVVCCWCCYFWLHTSLSRKQKHRLFILLFSIHEIQLRYDARDGWMVSAIDFIHCGLTVIDLISSINSTDLIWYECVISHLVNSFLILTRVSEKLSLLELAGGHYLSNWNDRESS